MVATIIVGVVFAAVILLAGKKVYIDTKNNKCSCSSSCSDQSKCSIK